MASYTEMFLEELTGMDVFRNVLLIQLQEVHSLKRQVEYLISDRPSQKLEAVNEKNGLKVLEDGLKVVEDGFKKLCMRLASLEKNCADQKVHLQEIQDSLQKIQADYLISDRQFCDRHNKKAEAVRETDEETEVLKQLEKMSIRVASLERTCADQK